MDNIGIKIILILIILCIFTLILLQIKKITTMDNLIDDTTYMIEDFNNITEEFKSESSDESGKPYMNLASKLDMLDKDYTTEKILIERDRTLLNAIKEKINKLLKATKNPTI
jgi:hypothetical protein